MKLGKRLYGLAQSPGNFIFIFDPALIGIGFVPLRPDTCVYIYQHNGVVIILTLSEDDLLIVGANIDLIGNVKRKLTEKVKMKDMGDVSLMLRMQVTRDRENGRLTISQENSTKSILDRFDMADCNPASTPGCGSELSTKQPEDTLLNEKETQGYQAITGSVMHFAQIFEVRHHVRYGSTRSCYVDTCEGTPGGG